jgi:indolepyruvate ferredoxin oxidoreductase alpha subunit
MHSSQNEQDSRFYAKFAMIPCLEPSNQQEAYDMMHYAFDLSESLRTPILLRVTTRMAHSRAIVETMDTPREQNVLSVPENTNHFILLPAFARKNYAELVESQADFIQTSEESLYNTYTKGIQTKRAFITTGIAYNYLMEAIGQLGDDVSDLSILKITQYPLPKALIEQMVADGAEEILVMEEGEMKGMCKRKTKESQERYWAEREREQRKPWNRLRAMFGLNTKAGANKWG